MRTSEKAPASRAKSSQSKVITKLNNGTKVKTTGNKIKKDGYVWYEITLENGSDNAWIAGSLIGY